MGVKISALPSNSTPALTDVFPENHGNATYKATLSDVRDLFGIPELEDDLNDLAPAIVPTKSGNVVAFSDGADDMPIKSLAVNVEPVQDLNGYDHPWVGGGGKNILPNTATTVTQSGVTFTVNSDGTVSTSGTSTKNANYIIVGTLTLVAGSYALNGCPSGGTSTTYYVRIHAINSDGTIIRSLGTDFGNGISFSVEEDTLVAVRIACDNGINMNGLAFKPMLRLATETDDTYVPYENICPISGWTAASVTKASGNLCAPTGERNTNAGITWVSDLNGTVTANGTSTGTSYSRSTLLSLPSGTYTVCDFANNANGYINVQNSTSWAVIATTSNGNPTSFTLTERTNIAIRCRMPSGRTVVDSVFMPMLMVGNVAMPSEFEQYNGGVFTVTFPTEAGTVYGGMVDSINGTLTVDNIGYTFKGTETVVAVAPLGNTTRCRFNNSEMGGLAVAANGALLCSHGVCAADHQGDYVHAETTTNYTYLFVPLASATAEQIQAYLKAQYDANTPWQVVYKRQTPLEYDITPTQIKTLYGNNTIYADCGSIADVEYPADTKKYIDSRLDDIESRLAAQKSVIAGVETGMTATKNYSIGDLLIVGETLYKVTAAIANGGAITVGTNVVATTVAEQLIALASA